MNRQSIPQTFLLVVSTGRVLSHAFSNRPLTRNAAIRSGRIDRIMNGSVVGSSCRSSKRDQAALRPGGGSRRGGRSQRVLMLFGQFRVEPRLQVDLAEVGAQVVVNLWLGRFGWGTGAALAVPAHQEQQKEEADDAGGDADDLRVRVGEGSRSVNVYLTGAESLWLWTIHQTHPKRSSKHWNQQRHQYNVKIICGLLVERG